MAAVTVRYWAAARAAARVAEETVSGETLADVLNWVRTEHGEALGRVLVLSSILVDGLPVTAREPNEVALRDGAVLEVLPPFAGG